MENKQQKKSLKVTCLFYSFFVSILILGIWGAKVVYASLISADHVVNDFQVSDLKGTIKEDFVPPTNDNPMKPGMSYPKKVAINNTSTTPFYVRVLVTPEIQSADGTLLTGNIGKEVSIDLGEDWLLGEDRYYYYLGKVGKGQTTSPLFTQVTLADNVDEAYTGAVMQIHVKSETIIAGKKQYREAWWDGSIPNTGVLQKIDTKLQNL